MENCLKVRNLGDPRGDSLCLICLQLYEDINVCSDLTTLQHLQNVFNKVSKYLSNNVFGTCFQWNFVKEGSSPICSTCYSSVEKIFSVDEKVEKLQKNIQDLVDSFTCAVLECHNGLQGRCSKENEAPGNDYQRLVNVISDIKCQPDLEIDTKEELRGDTVGDLEVGDLEDDTIGCNSQDELRISGLISSSKEILDEVLVHHNRLQDLYTQENEVPDDDDDSQFSEKEISEIQYEPDVDIDIKEEIRLEADDEDNASNALDDMENRGGFSFGNELQNREEMSTRKPTVRSKCNNSSVNKTCLKDLRIVLKRFDFDAKSRKNTKPTDIPELKIVLTKLKLDAKSKGVVAVKNVPEVRQRSKRKAAVVAKEVLKKFAGNNIQINPAKDVESEQDWSLDSENENSEREFTSEEEDSESTIITKKKKSVKKVNRKRNLFPMAMYFRYKCSYKNCYEYFSKIKLLKRHMKIHGANSSMKCQICTKKFSTSKGLARHIHCTHKEKSLQCNQCNKTFLYKQNLKLHSQKHKRKHYECKICNKKFLWRVSLNTHTRNEHSNEKYNCTICNKKCRNRLNLLRHRFTHFTSKITDIFPCNACKKVHFKQKIWDKCIIKHFRKAKAGFICSVCSAVFKKSKDLDKHSAKKKHLNKKLFTCLKCGKGFYRRKDLKDHLRVHQGRKMSGSKIVGVNAARTRNFTLENVYFKFKCNYKNCTKAFRRVKQLKKHMKIHESNVLFKCEICPKKFKSPKDFFKHNYYNHNDKLFKCSKCDKSFRKKLNLEFHSKVHSAKRFECKTCLKRFYWKVSLNVHLRIGHNEKKYTCNICKKNFSSRMNLVQHRSSHFKSKVKETFPCSGCKNIHFVERIWDNCIVNHFRTKSQVGCVCAICTTVFKTSRELDKHSIATKHSNKKLFTCLRCKMRFYRRIDLDQHKSASKTERNKKRLKKSNNFFDCVMCQRQFCKRLHLHSHIRLFHKKGDGYFCSVCKTQFIDIQKLRDHMKIHKGEISYQCKMCSTKFSSKQTWKHHCKFKCAKIKTIRKLSVDPRNYNCDICHKEFRTTRILSRHMKRHKNEKGIVFGCTICGERYKDIRSLRDHKNRHSVYIVYECGCKKRFSKKHSFIQHRQNCTGNFSQTTPNSYECLFCDKVFNSENKLNFHRRIHGKKKKLPCKLCGKSIVRSYMQNHLSTHSSQQLKCNQCEMTFNTDTKLERHQLSMHCDERPFPCNFCSVKFKTKAYLNKHIRRTHNSDPILCDVCGKNFSAKDKLQIHKRKHTGDMFPCEHCDKKFYGRYAVKRHIQIVHTKEIKFTCELCEKNFTSLASLHLHKNTHMGERKFSCSKCEKTFVQKTQLDGHFERIHAERNLKCNHCEKRFASKLTLASHIKSTHSEKKFQCEMCSYMCRMKHYLTTHIRTHHTKERPYVCEKCGDSFSRKEVLNIHMKGVHGKEKSLEDDYEG